jgi:hypothetical protein
LPAVRHVVAVVRDVAAPVVHRLAPAVHVAAEPLRTRHFAHPQHLSSTRVPSRAHLFDRAMGRALLPDARLLVVRSEAAAPRATTIAAAKAVTQSHAAPQLTLTSLCKAQPPGTVSPGAAGGGAAAALSPREAHAPPLALVRLVAPLQAPRSHVLLLRIERPD